jgi:hypothetical protein
MSKTSNGRYRLNNPTLALIEKDGRHVARTIPTGAVVELDGQHLEGDKLIEARWDGHTVMIFSQDLRARSEPAD